MAVLPVVMHRQVPFLVFYILLWFAFPNDAESLPTLQDQCLEFDIVDLEKYISALNFTNVPTVDAMFAGLECPITALPFGFLRSDWARLSLLRNALAEDSILSTKLERLFRIMIIAYLRIERSLVPNRYSNETSDRHAVTTERLFYNTTTIVFGNIASVNENRGDIKEKENRSEQENVLELVTTEFTTKNETDVTASSTENHLPKGFTVSDILCDRIGTCSIPYVNKLTERMNEDSTFKDRNEKIVKGAEKVKEEDLVGSSKSSTPRNVEVGSVANSRSTVKFNGFGTSTEKLNSIVSLSTSRTEVFEGTVLQESETERTTSRTINFHESDSGGNRNIEDDRDYVFTTLPARSSSSTDASANGRTDVNRFDTDREEIKNDMKYNVPFATDASVRMITILPEKSEKFAVTFFQNTSTEASISDTSNSYHLNDTSEKMKNNDCSDASSTTNVSDVTSFTSLENSGLSGTTKSSGAVNTDENVKASVDRSSAASTQASTRSGTMRSIASDLTTRQDLEETTSNELSISKKDNPSYRSNVAKNSIVNSDPSDPSRSNVYDVFAHEPDKFDSDIDGSSRRAIGNKVKKLMVFRKQPPGNIMSDYKEIVRNAFTLVSETITVSTNSIVDGNEFKENSLDSRKRGYTNTNAENNFRFFYNLGGRPIGEARKNGRGFLDTIRVKCKDESK